MDKSIDEKAVEVLRVLKTIMIRSEVRRIVEIIREAARKLEIDETVTVNNDSFMYIFERSNYERSFQFPEGPRLFHFNFEAHSVQITRRS